MAERGDKSRREKRAGKPFKGVSDKGWVCEYKNVSQGNFYMTLPPGTSPEEAAILYDLVRLRIDPNVDERVLNLEEVLKSLGIPPNIDKKCYQEYLAAIPLGSLKKEEKKKEFWVKAQEVYSRLTSMKASMLGETKGKRRRDEVDIHPKLEEGGRYVENLNAEALQSLITSKIAALERAEKACKEKDAIILSQDVVISGKDAKIRELEEEVLHKDAEKRRLQEEANENAYGRTLEHWDWDSRVAANENAYGRTLEHWDWALFVTGELPPGDACMSEDAMPALGDSLQTSSAAADERMTSSDDPFNDDSTYKLLRM